MNLTNKVFKKRCNGAVLVISMIFILIFSALAVALAALSGTNVQVANNQHKANSALATAQSGHEIVHFWLSCVSIPGTTPQNQKFSMVTSNLQSLLSASGITIITDAAGITIPIVSLDTVTGKYFYASITPLDVNTFRVDVTGVANSITRTIRGVYEFGTRANNVFNYGVATKGPLSLAGNIELEGVNVSVEASVYIESESSNLALSIIGNSQIAGDVSIVNPIANVFLQGGQAGIGGATGDEAIEDHVTIGVPPSEFPTPDPTCFSGFVTDDINSHTNTSDSVTYENVRIAAGTNPNFTGNVTLKGIIYVEPPNVVTFSGNTNVTGIIVGNGSIADNSGVNQINFLGGVTSASVNQLPDEPQFIGMKDKTGTFVMAPGFSVSFGGNFHTLNGAVAANGVTFFGNAGGTIMGSILNYSDEQMILTGNSDLYFNRSGVEKVPAGFIPEFVLRYIPTSYSEIAI